jgi:hypothetical protein
MPEPVLPPGRYERSDVTVRFALVAFPLILLGIFGSALLVMWIYPGTTTDRRLPSAVPAYPSPRLQSDPPADLQKFLQAEHARLDSAGWDDKTQGAGHISISEAMRRIAASGIPDWPK